MEPRLKIMNAQKLKEQLHAQCNRERVRVWLKCSQNTSV